MGQNLPNLNNVVRILAFVGCFLAVPTQIFAQEDRPSVVQGPGKRSLAKILFQLEDS